MSVDFFLHKMGYNFFTIPLLSLKEVKQLIDGNQLSQDRSQGE